MKAEKIMNTHSHLQTKMRINAKLGIFVCTFFSSCRSIYIVNVEVWDLIVSNFDRGPFQLWRDYKISRIISFDVHIT